VTLLPRIHGAALFTDHAHLLCGGVVATLRGFDGFGRRCSPGDFLQLLFAHGKGTLAGRWRSMHEDLAIERFARWTRLGALPRQ